MNITKEQLRQIIPKNPYVDHWHGVLSKLFPDYEINTPARMAAFLAQCVHESGGFTTLKENLNYRPVTLRKIFGKYFPTDALAEEYCSKPNKQEAIANRVYANRMGNGDEASGRGLIQLTGRDNYSWFAASIEISPEDASEYLQTFEGAAQSACWFWESNNLNTFADVGDLLTMTKRINGGTIGMEHRKHEYQHAMKVFGA